MEDGRLVGIDYFNIRIESDEKVLIIRNIVIIEFRSILALDQLECCLVHVGVVVNVHSSELREESEEGEDRDE